jgi:hypothetical protein
MTVQGKRGQGCAGDETKVKSGHSLACQKIVYRCVAGWRPKPVASHTLPNLDRA